MGLLARLKREGSALMGESTAATGIPWQRDERGYYFRLLRLHPREAGILGVGGVYLAWHRGAHPRWVYVGATENLGEAIDLARDSEAVLSYEPFGGVYVTWAPILPEYRSGVANYLREVLSPEIAEVLPTDALDANASPIPVVPPS